MFPTFLGPLQPLPQEIPATLDSPRGGAGTGARSLAFAMQTQQGDNWCWAATTSSVAQFFDPGSTWTQCDIASACLQVQCCATPRPCDVQFTLDDPLRRTGNLQGNPFAGNDTMDNLQLEIDGGRPVCCHISWNGGGGHFVAISGYNRGTDDVFIEDPLYGEDSVPFSEFVSSYRGSGSWDFTYYTQP